MKQVEKNLKQIIELCQFEELYHDGINIDIKNLCEQALAVMKGKK